MSPKVKSATAVLDETEQEVVAKPVKDVKAIKEKAKIMEQSSTDEYEEDDIDINPQKYITVISLCSGQLNLSTLPGGKGKVFSFQKFGESKRIMYQNLVDIIEVSPRFLNDGFYYIADKKVIRKHGLNSVYDNLLTKEMIENIFTKAMAEEKASEVYKSANKQQQSVIIDLIVRKLMLDDTNIDMNMVAIISKVSGVDIQKKVDDEKFYSQKPA
jgi:hypothetical protein